MEAIIHAKQLREQVGALQGILNKKMTIPVLSQIKIDATQTGAFVMTATDLDISLIIEQEVDILETGSICLSGKKLGEITGSLPNEPVHLKLDESCGKVEFRAGRFRSKLSGTDSNTFPEIARVSAESLKLPGAVFYEGLQRTIFAVTEDNKRFTMSCILLVLDGSSFKMVSTDGARLCLFQTAVIATAQKLELLIPLKAARELKNLISGEIRSNQKAEIKIKKGSQLEFAIGNKLMTARELTGAFPNWEMVIPKAFEFFAETKAAELKEALTRVCVMAEDSHRRVDFTFFHNKLVLKSESSEAGSSTEEINCTFQRLRNAGEPAEDLAAGWKIAFNTKYLMDFLALQNARESESRVIWKFGSNLSQCLLTFEGEERLFSYVLVPLK